MISIRWLVIPAALALAACAGVPYKAKLPDLGSATCVDDLRAMPRIPLGYFQPASKDATAEPYVEFADVAHCLRFGAMGTTPIALYQLQGVKPPAEVAISVTLSTGGTFAAAVEVLDADFHSLHRYDFHDFVRRGMDYSLHAFLNDTSQKPAYIMLLPDRSEAGKSDVALGSQTNAVVIPAGPVYFIYNNGTESHSIRPFLEGGRVSVTAKPQVSAAFTPESGR